MFLPLEIPQTSVILMYGWPRASGTWLAFAVVAWPIIHGKLSKSGVLHRIGESGWQGPLA
jgi:hypothetical protein